MTVTGEMLIGGTSVRGKVDTFRAFDPATNAEIDPVFFGGGAEEVDRACRLAADAFESFRALSPEAHHRFMSTAADNLEALGTVVTERVMAETGLPRGRAEGERARTVAQFRMFADIARTQNWRRPVIDSGDPQRTPAPRPELRMSKVAIGPVAVFGSSNFPFLYSVAGGDTASALAAGCPVVVKAHGSHPGTSELVGRAIQQAVAQCDLHEGVFSLLFGSGNAIGEALVDHPAIKAVGFTGSEGGGMALVRRGLLRQEPIPVFAEMTSTNPTFVLPGALAERSETFGRKFADQMAIGVGQMCLKPGVIVAIRGAGFDRLLETLKDAVAAKPAATMLSPNISANYLRAVKRHGEQPGTVSLVVGGAPAKSLDGQAHILETDAADFLASPVLAEEMFGPAALLVCCDGPEQLISCAQHLRGQLTVTLQMEPSDLDLAKRLMPILELKTNRIIANGYSNMVEISHATIHGGPFPATSDSRFTSVGATAIERFLRPICYQNLPQELLPSALQEENPQKLWRLKDGAMTRE